MEIIEIKNLSFTYPLQKTKALDDITIRIQQGDFVVLCGESGCGKTTLLKLLKRELAPHGEKQGKIYYCGTPLEQLDDRTAACDIGYVMQNPENQVVTDKVWHEMAFGLESMGMETSVIRRRVGEMAAFFGITDWFRKKTTELSGGQKQLLNLASVMVMQPKILILDEPTSQLDPIAASEFIGTLQKLNKELGLTILLVEHRLEDVFPIADKIAVMDAGRILLYEAPQNAGKRLKEIYQNHKMLLGLPSAVRIYNGLNIDAPCPLTVRDGRNFLSDHFKNDIAEIETEPFCPNPDIAVELKNVWFRYERDLPDVLRGVSVKIHKGEIFSILGANGTGKTTALNVISGQNRAYRGQVTVDGLKIKEYRNGSLYRRNLALLPQNPQTVFLKSTVETDFQEICKQMGYKKEESQEKIHEIAEQLNISKFLQKHPYDLSGGEQQKAALAKILLLQPKIILLDEPTKGIDAYYKYSLDKILKELQQQGITIIMVTHDVEFAATVSNRCAMLFDGEIISADAPAAFFSDNNFYTTAANRISRHMYCNAITCEDVIEICKRNGEKNEP
jgi:energy-coupling factor transport system ATP-binding protein